MGFEKLKRVRTLDLHHFLWQIIQEGLAFCTIESDLSQKKDNKTQQQHREYWIVGFEQRHQSNLLEYKRNHRFLKE